MCARFLTFLCNRVNFLVDEDAKSSLKSTVGSIVIWGFELGGEPCWFTIRGLGEGTGCWNEDLGGFVDDGADAEVGVFLEDFLSIISMY